MPKKKKKKIEGKTVRLTENCHNKISILAKIKGDTLINVFEEVIEFYCKNSEYGSIVKMIEKAQKKEVTKQNDPVVEDIKSTEEVEIVEDTKSTEEVKTVEDTKSTEEVETVEDIKSTEEVETVEDTKSTEEVETVEDTKSTEEVGTAEEEALITENDYNDMTIITSTSTGTKKFMPGMSAINQYK